MAIAYKLDENTTILVTPAEKAVLDFLRKNFPPDVVAVYFKKKDAHLIIEKLTTFISKGTSPYFADADEPLSIRVKPGDADRVRFSTKYSWHAMDWTRSEGPQQLQQLLSNLDEEDPEEKQKVEREKPKFDREQHARLRKEQQNLAIRTQPAKHGEKLKFDRENQVRLRREQQSLATKKQFAERSIEQYKILNIEYKKYLKNKIIKKINKIDDEATLEKMYKLLIKTPDGQSSDNIPEKTQYMRKKITTNLLNQYEHLEKELDKELKTRPRLLASLKKYTVITQAGLILGSSESNENKINSFHAHLKMNKKVFQKEYPDSGFKIFLKGLGVAAATIFGVGVGGYFAYKTLFPTKQSTLRAKKYIDNVASIPKRNPSKKS